MVLWQNCSRSRLAPTPDVAMAQAPSLNLQATICPQVQTLPPQPTNFLFVVHMGASNLGQWQQIPAGSGFWYFNTSLAVDPMPANPAPGTLYGRFAAIQYFMQNCGSNVARYAVIGFSDDAGLPNGNDWDCGSINFSSDVNQWTQVLTDLQNQQISAEPWYNTWQQPNYLTQSGLAGEPPLVRDSSWAAGLQCAQSVVVNDLINNNSTSSPSSYQVVFLAGLNPDEEAGTGCNQGSTPGSSAPPAQFQSCELQQINSSISYMTTAALSEGQNLKVYDITYGATVNDSLPYPDTVANDGGTTAPMVLQSFQNNTSAICKLIASQLSVLQRPDSFMAVNMTTINQADQQLADSDMDGIPDTLEVQIGSDPTNPRSMVPSVLDGVCARLYGGVSTCAKAPAACKSKCQQAAQNIQACNQPLAFPPTNS